MSDEPKTRSSSPKLPQRAYDVLAAVLLSQEQTKGSRDPQEPSVRGESRQGKARTRRKASA